MQAQDTTWLFIHDWVNKNKTKIVSFVYKRYYLKYSPYPVEDFVAEAYLIAYEALSICGDKPFEGYFWTLLKEKCRAELANQPHESFMLKHEYVKDRSYEVREDDVYLDDDEYVRTVITYLNILSPSQKQVCRLIAFSNGPVKLSQLADVIGITYKVVLDRFNSSIKRIEKARLRKERKA